MYRLGHAAPDLTLHYQRATAVRDAAIARGLDQLINKGAARPGGQISRRRPSNPSPGPEQLTLD